MPIGTIRSPHRGDRKVNGVSKRAIAGLLLAAYTAFIVWLLVSKIDLIVVGHLRLRFAATVGDPNFVPFATIMSYLSGEPRWFFALLNLVGNIVLFVPIGLLACFALPNFTWRKALALGTCASLLIETLQGVLGIGIVDIDDVLLNTFGAMTGFWLTMAFIKFNPWRRNPTKNAPAARG